MKTNTFKFNKNDQIGAAGAEDDAEFLSTCYIDTGDLSLLKNINDRRCIVLGRTGAGKTALLSRLEEAKDHVIRICPENLALTYVTNSTILSFFSNLGVNLDPFFKLLWRHVFIVEILHAHLKEPAGGKQKSLLDILSSMFTGNSRHDKEMKEAISYLRVWGKSFWKETEFRVREITSKLENDLASEINAQIGISGLKSTVSLKSATKFTEEQKSELLSRGQEVVSRAQVQDLHKVMNLIDIVLEDRQKQYYIVIDRLDENWVEEKIRYKMIMALIQTSRDFIKVKHAKVIIALRRDLIERVFRLTRESGFQEEKHQSLYLPLKWTKNDLLELLDRRIAALVSRRYTKEKVSHRDLLPKSYNSIPIKDFIFQIAQRPRDIISFFNTCISVGTNLSRLRVRDLRNAEGEYSRSRLKALGDEWSADYPSLLDFFSILEKKPSSFKISTIKNSEVEELSLRIAIENPGGQGLLRQYALKVTNCILETSDFTKTLIKIFYSIGFVGLKIYPYESESWVDEIGRGVSISEVSEESSVVIHPAFHRALGIKKQRKGSNL